MMEKILVIQDSPSVNAVLQFRLEGEGFSVEAVETGKEGIEKAGRDAFRLILLDYNLPDINGIEVCKSLRKQDNNADTPIVFISAKDEDEISQGITDAGANGYIGMPFEGSAFMGKIRGFMGKP